MVDLTYINQALTRTGNGSIAQLNDGSSPSNIAGANYDGLVSEVLASYPWRWASKTAVLTAISGTPNPPWLKAYQIPPDLKHLSAVEVQGQPITYEVQFNKLLCNIDTTVDVIAKYIWDVPEAYWPPEFGELITIRLEAMFLRGIGERFQEATDRDRAALRKLSECKTIDSKRRTARNPVTSPTLAARGAVVPTGTVMTARTG